MRRLLVLVALLASALAAPLAAAHGAGADLPGDSLARATPLGLPARVFDEAAGGGDAHYYRLDLERGSLVRLRLVAPAGQEPAEPPVVFVFGHEFDGEVSALAGVERPEMGGVSFVAKERAEGASPALATRWSVLLEREVALEAGPHVIVVRTASAGPVALLLETPAARWIDPFLLPGLRDDARAWKGAPSWPPLVAGALGAAAVGALAWRSRGRAWSLHAMAAHLFALLAAATSLAHAADALAARVGLGYAAAGLACAGAALASTRPALSRPAWWQRALLAAAAVVGFFVYAGALWGPVAGVLGALLPEPSESE